MLESTEIFAGNMRNARRFVKYNPGVSFLMRFVMEVANRSRSGSYHFPYYTKNQMGCTC